MPRNRSAFIGPVAVLVAVGLIAGAQAQTPPPNRTPSRAQLIQVMEQNCFSTHANDDPSIKGQCGCYAKAFVDSLTPGEIAVPKPSAEINRKLADARRRCNIAPR
jgi:hypothetical protein